MFRRAAVRAGILLFAALGAAACPPVTSKTPLGTTHGTAHDPVLTGVWRGYLAGGKTFSYFTLLPQKDGTVTAVVVTPPSKDDEGGWGVFSAQAVQLGSNRYMNARETFDDGKPASGKMADNTIPVLYRVGGDGSLALYIIDENPAKAAIKAGKIAGSIEEGQFGDVVLTAHPGELDAFMATPGARALFGKPLVILRKVK